MKLNVHSTGLAVGSFFLLAHFLWSLLVASGYAQACVDLFQSLHFFSSTMEVQEFVPSKALMLLVIAAVWGYVVGVVFATLYNAFSKGK